jgi:zinc transport system ATP-binding protein
MTPGAAALEIEGLCVRRGPERVLDGVSLSLFAGAVHAVVGPNGGGKSTLIAAILGALPYDGVIRQAAPREPRGRRIGYVPQAFPVDPTLPLTVRDFLALGRQRRPVCLGVDRAAAGAADEILARVGLPGFAGRPLGALSGGERQRVLLAQAIDPPPDLLLLDEPLSAVDAPSAALVDELLATAVRSHGTAALMVTHDLEHVRRAAAVVTVLRRRVLRQGAPADVLPAGLRADFGAA